MLAYGLLQHVRTHLAEKDEADQQKRSRIDFISGVVRMWTPELGLAPVEYSQTLGQWVLTVAHTTKVE
jgi:hypothetical protein